MTTTIHALADAIEAYHRSYRVPEIYVSRRPKYLADIARIIDTAPIAVSLCLEVSSRDKILLRIPSYPIAEYGTGEFLATITPSFGGPEILVTFAKVADLSERVVWDNAADEISGQLYLWIDTTAPEE